jgi:hypothetical protein
MIDSVYFFFISLDSFLYTDMKNLLIQKKIEMT